MRFNGNFQRKYLHNNKPANRLPIEHLHRDLCAAHYKSQQVNIHFMFSKYVILMKEKNVCTYNQSLSAYFSSVFE